MHSLLDGDIHHPAGFFQIILKIGEIAIKGGAQIPYHGLFLSHPAADIILSQLALRLDEHSLGGRKLYQLAQPQKCGEVRDWRCLLHIVRDDHKDINELRFFDQLFQAPGGNQLEGLSWLVY